MSDPVENLIPGGDPCRPLRRAMIALTIVCVWSGAVHAQSALPPPTPTTTFLTISANPSALGASVTLTASVSPSGANGPFEGTITFKDLESGAALGSQPFNGGTVTLTTSSLAPGLRSLVAQFSGSPLGAPGGFAPSDSATLLQEVTPNAATGNFTTAAGSPFAVYTDGTFLGGVAVADFNGDGIPDMAVTNPNDENVTVLKGNGDGSFTPFSTIPVATGAEPFLIAVGDFNNDGYLDLAVTEGVSGKVAVLKGNGDGTFEPFPLSPFSAPGGSGIAVGDFNSDGNLDIAITGGASENIVVLLGDGTGAFPTSSEIGDSREPGPLVAGDFNKDGFLDLAVVNANPDTGKNVSVFLGNGSGGFSLHGAPFLVSNSPGSITVGDFTNSGVLDLAVGADLSLGGGTTTGFVYLFKGDGSGGFTQIGQISDLQDPVALVAGDFNGDGNLDLAIADSKANHVTVQVGDGSGGFTTASSPGFTDPVGLAVADLTGDGALDIALVSASDSNVRVFLGVVVQTITVTTPPPVTEGYNQQFMTSATGGGSGQPVTIQGSGACSGTGSGSATITMTSTSGTCTVTYNQAAGSSGGVSYAAAAAVTATVTVATPALTVTKSVTSTGPYNAVGQTISYSFLTVNTGNVTLSSVGITDTQTAPAGALTAAPACQSLSSPTGACSGATTTLLPGQSATFTASYIITQADLNNGSVSDSATAGGTPPGGSAITSAPSTATVTMTASPALTVTKSVTSAGPYNAVGQTISYSFLAKNTGNVTLSSVGITDTQTAPAGTLTSGPACQGLSSPAGACSGATTTLVPGQSATFTASYSITQADLNNGSVSDSATAGGTPPGGSAITSAPSRATVTTTASPALTVTKSVTSTGPYNAVGQTISYSFSARNTGNVTLTSVGITDTQTAPAGALTAAPACQSLSTPAGACSGATTTLLPGQSATFTASYSITQADLNNGSVSDSATAGGTPPGGSAITSPPSTVTVATTASPALTVTKSVTSTGPYNAVGQTISYSFLAKNTGNVTLSSVGITDTQTAPAGTLTSPPACQSLSTPAGACSGATTTLLPGQSATFTGSYTIAQADLNNGSVKDSATASGTPPGGSPVTSPPSTVTVTTTSAPALTVTKSVTSTGPYNAVGQTISYSFLAKNTGNVTLSSVGITDTQTTPAGALTAAPACQGLSSPAGACSGATTTLLPGQSATFTGSYTIAQADLNNGSVRDSATASGTPPGGSPVTSPPSTVTVTTTSAPALTVTKSVTSTGPYNTVGQTISYSFLAKNTGNVTLSSVGISDTQTAPAGALTAAPACQGLSSPAGACSGATTTLLPGQSATFTGSYTIAQADLNNGSVRDSATASGTPPGGSAITSPPSTVTVTTTASPALTVTKSVTSTGPYNTVGQTISYSFLAKNTGNVTLSSVGISDTQTAPAGALTAAPACQSLSTPAGACSGATTTLLPGQSATFTASYSITQADLSNGSVSDSATASGTPPGGSPVTSPPSTATVATIPVAPAPTVLSYSVICGSACAYNMIGTARVHLPWQITGIQVVFSQPITSASVNSLTGVVATGFSGLGTNTLTWTFTGVTNSSGSLTTTLAGTGPNAIQSAGGALTGSNTSEALKILEGDFNDDGVVNASDMTLVNNARSASYNILADINGDGVVNTADVTAVRAQNGQTNP